MSSELAYLPQIISAISGLFGAFVGGLVTWIVQTQRLKHERNVEKAKRFAREQIDEANRRNEFLKSIWERDTKLLIDTKVAVRRLLQHTKLSLDETSESELIPLIEHLQNSSGYLTSFPEIVKAIDIFIKEARQVLVAAKTNNAAVLGGIVYDNFLLHGNLVIEECDRFIYKQPDESPSRILRIATSFITTNLSQSIVYTPNNENHQSSI